MIPVDPIGPPTICDETTICAETTLCDDGPAFLETSDGSLTTDAPTPGTLTLTPAS